MLGYLMNENFKTIDEVKIDIIAGKELIDQNNPS